MKNNIRLIARLACGLLAAAGAARGAGHWDPEVRITNPEVVSRTEKTATLRFDVWWEGSWRHAVNHDAAWVFFKIRADAPPAASGAGGAGWQHVRLAADRVVNPTGYGQAPIPPAPAGGGALHYYQGRTGTERTGGVESGVEVFAKVHRDTPLEFLVPAGEGGAGGGAGVFLRRAEPGQGVVQARGVTVLMDLTALKGIADPGKATIRGFGLEMVYVAEGPFSLGTGGIELDAFHEYREDGDSTRPYRVKNAGPIPTGRQAGKLWARGVEPEDGGEIPPAFPNGYAAFYCMKQHVSPRRYAEFLSTLPPAEAEARYPAPIPFGPTVMRSGQAPNYTYEFRVGGGRDGMGMRTLAWADGAAYAAWAGLRPMTELELEKIVRGPRLPIPEECGPSYWGLFPFYVYEWNAIKGWDTMSERAVTAGHAKGRAFKGTHGDGSTALPADWPQADAVGSGIRCLPHPDLDRAFVSDRYNAALADVERKFKFRFVRTAPDSPGVGGAASARSR